MEKYNVFALYHFSPSSSDLPFHFTLLRADTMVPVLHLQPVGSSQGIVGKTMPPNLAEVLCVLINASTLFPSCYSTPHRALNSNFVAHAVLLTTVCLSPYWLHFSTVHLYNDWIITWLHNNIWDHSILKSYVFLCRPTAQCYKCTLDSKSKPSLNVLQSMIN